MKALLLLCLVVGADAGHPDAGRPSLTVTTWQKPEWWAYGQPPPDYWEQGPVICLNHAKPKLETRDGGTWIVCDLRKKK